SSPPFTLASLWIVPAASVPRANGKTKLTVAPGASPGATVQVTTGPSAVQPGGNDVRAIPAGNGSVIVASVVVAARPSCVSVSVKLAGCPGARLAGDAVFVSRRRTGPGPTSPEITTVDRHRSSPGHPGSPPPATVAVLPMNGPTTVSVTGIT